MKKLKLRIANNEMKYDIFGISEAFNRALEWRSRGAEMIKRDVSPALRATDYKCPKYVWYKSNEINMNGKQPSVQDRIYSPEGTSTAITTCFHVNIQEPINAMPDGTATTQTTAHHYSGNIVNPKRGQTEMGVREDFRIRKLTPRECFRLMDVDDKDIDTIQAAGISDSQQYKLAGNSIVVNVLTEIFRKLLVDTQNDDRQLRMF